MLLLLLLMMMLMWQPSVTVHQLTLDIEQYLGEAVKTVSHCHHDYLAMTDYDLQMIDVSVCCCCCCIVYLFDITHQLAVDMILLWGCLRGQKLWDHNHYTTANTLDISQANTSTPPSVSSNFCKASGAVKTWWAWRTPTSTYVIQTLAESSWIPAHSIKCLYNDKNRNIFQLEHTLMKP